MHSELNDVEKEVSDMNVCTTEKNRLNLSKLKTRKVQTLSSEKALHDVTPIVWSKEVLSGDKKVVITKAK